MGLFYFNHIRSRAPIFQLKNRLYSTNIEHLIKNLDNNEVIKTTPDKKYRIHGKESVIRFRKALLEQADLENKSLGTNIEVSKKKHGIRVKDKNKGLDPGLIKKKNKSKHPIENSNKGLNLNISNKLNDTNTYHKSNFNNIYMPSHDIKNYDFITDMIRQMNQPHLDLKPVISTNDLKSSLANIEGKQSTKHISKKTSLPNSTTNLKQNKTNFHINNGTLHTLETYLVEKDKQTQEANVIRTIKREIELDNELQKEKLNSSTNSFSIERYFQPEKFVKDKKNKQQIEPKEFLIYDLGSQKNVKIIDPNKFDQAFFNINYKDIFSIINSSSRPPDEALGIINKVEQEGWKLVGDLYGESKFLIVFQRPLENVDSEIDTQKKTFQRLVTTSTLITVIMVCAFML
ncbi:hypothetical protein TBLA_0B03750 [Henningerozyma blattae CBS 6284]|uniref:Uncharacterized protein n=1 Tax=Henningerozyma blattae (strain ATCC 34711 / CBS 6284 / DSM 70876 / NBRC 10599 / NRRL Y-10934 / UCD 77-7) TaxID=1071380 RepID=I2GYL2_HENB6|nr:hypothetical protein TBLA_0B03750 [Tetrapisispora blattae CBS 6284]CCH59214.1 hypothetical protein TBLA_0B03750 [Tetrapisispora blattae CBS 6284]